MARSPRRLLAGGVLVSAAAVLIAIAAISTPATAGPPRPSGPEPAPVDVYAFEGDDADVDSKPKKLNFAVQRFPTGAPGGFTDQVGMISVAPARGGPHRVGRFAHERNGESTDHRVDPCAIGGKDLPDERFTVTVEYPDLNPPYRYSKDLRLGPDTTKPTVKKIQSSPPPESKVEPGDRIRFEVVGREDLPGDTWQTGVQTLQVTGPRGLIDDKSAGRTPKACGDKSESLTINDKYRVRRGDPAVIEICGIAEDYAANEGSNCAKYYKGEVWEGTYEGSLGGGASGCTFSVSGTLQVVVARDGGVSGGGSDYAPPPTCPGGAGQGRSANFTVTGTRENGTFQLTLTYEGTAIGGEFPDLAVRGTRARGEVESTLPDGSTQRTTMTLECKTCEEEAVG